MKTTRNNLELLSRMTSNSETLDDGSVTARCLSLFDLVVDPTDDSVCVHLLNGGHWESWITSYICNTVQKDWVCVDIGANVGYFTLLMSYLASAGSTEAFEPNPAYAAMIESSAAINGRDNIKVFQLAISDTLGSATLSVPGSLKGSASIVQKFDDTYGKEVNYEVSTVPLDETGLGKVDFIKVDAEGAEELIWHGMQKTLSNNPECIVLLEWDSRRFPDGAFARTLWETCNISVVDYAGEEQPMDFERLNNSQDIEMIVLVKK